MKKLFALTLAFVLALGLCAPALAVEVPEELEPLGLEDFPVVLPDVEEVEPTLTLVVNGVATDVALTAADGVTYADAAQLRSALGTGVSPTLQGTVAVRQVAQSGGWEVEWYDGGWLGVDQQVCLWNKDKFLTDRMGDLGLFQEFYQTLVDLTRDQLWPATPKKINQTATLSLTRFDTLDGNRTYEFRLRAETIVKDGVADCTITCNLGDLVKFLTAQELGAIAEKNEMTQTAITNLLQSNKVEVIMDLNAGGIAVNAPILALVDPELEGWHITYRPELVVTMEDTMDMNVGAILYDTMRAAASSQGGRAAGESMDQTLAFLGALTGEECIAKDKSGKFSYNLTAQRVNAALTQALAVETEVEDVTANWFKKFDLTYSVDPRGGVNASMTLRPDTAGIGATVSALTDEDSPWISALARLVAEGFDMEIVAQTNGNLKSEASETLRVHWANVGTFSLRADTAVTDSVKTPRQMADVERLWVSESYIPLEDRGLAEGTLTP